MKKKLGQTRFASLMIQAYTYKKRDDAMDKLIIEMLEKHYADDN